MSIVKDVVYGQKMIDLDELVLLWLQNEMIIMYYIVTIKRLYYQVYQIIIWHQNVNMLVFGVRIVPVHLVMVSNNCFVMNIA